MLKKFIVEGCVWGWMDWDTVDSIFCKAVHPELGLEIDFSKQLKSQLGEERLEMGMGRFSITVDCEDKGDPEELRESIRKLVTDVLGCTRWTVITTIGGNSAVQGKVRMISIELQTISDAPDKV
jgi:hypothetical protein